MFSRLSTVAFHLPGVVDHMLSMFFYSGEGLEDSDLCDILAANTTHGDTSHMLIFTPNGEFPHERRAVDSWTWLEGPVRSWHNSTRCLFSNDFCAPAFPKKHITLHTCQINAGEVDQESCHLVRDSYRSFGRWDSHSASCSCYWGGSPFSVLQRTGRRRYRIYWLWSEYPNEDATKKAQYIYFRLNSAPHDVRFFPWIIYIHALTIY